MDGQSHLFTLRQQARRRKDIHTKQKHMKALSTQDDEVDDAYTKAIDASIAYFEDHCDMGEKRTIAPPSFEPSLNNSTGSSVSTVEAVEDCGYSQTTIEIPRLTTAGMTEVPEPLRHLGSGLSSGSCSPKASSPKAMSPKVKRRILRGKMSFGELDFQVLQRRDSMPGSPMMSGPSSPSNSRARASRSPTNGRVPSTGGVTLLLPSALSSKNQSPLGFHGIRTVESGNGDDWSPTLVASSPTLLRSCSFAEQPTSIDLGDDVRMPYRDYVDAVSQLQQSTAAPSKKDSGEFAVSWTRHQLHGLPAPTDHQLSLKARQEQQLAIMANFEKQQRRMQLTSATTVESAGTTTSASANSQLVSPLSSDKISITSPSRRGQTNKEPQSTLKRQQSSSTLLSPTKSQQQSPSNTSVSSPAKEQRRLYKNLRKGTSRVPVGMASIISQIREDGNNTFRELSKAFLKKVDFTILKAAKIDIISNESMRSVSEQESASIAESALKQLNESQHERSVGVNAGLFSAMEFNNNHHHQPSKDYHQFVSQNAVREVIAESTHNRFALAENMFDHLMPEDVKRLKAHRNELRRGFSTKGVNFPGSAPMAITIEPLLPAGESDSISKASTNVRINGLRVKCVLVGTVVHVGAEKAAAVAAASTSKKEEQNKTHDDQGELLRDSSGTTSPINRTDAQQQADQTHHQQMTSMKRRPGPFNRIACAKTATTVTPKMLFEQARRKEMRQKIEKDRPKLKLWQKMIVHGNRKEYHEAMKMKEEEERIEKLKEDLQFLASKEDGGDDWLEQVEIAESKLAAALRTRRGTVHQQIIELPSSSTTAAAGNHADDSESSGHDEDDEAELAAAASAPRLTTESMMLTFLGGNDGSASFSPRSKKEERKAKKQARTVQSRVQTLLEDPPDPMGVTIDDLRPIPEHLQHTLDAKKKVATEDLRPHEAYNGQPFTEFVPYRECLFFPQFIATYEIANVEPRSMRPEMQHFAAEMFSLAQQAKQSAKKESFTPLEFTTRWSSAIEQMYTQLADDCWVRQWTSFPPNVATQGLPVPQLLNLCQRGSASIDVVDGDDNVQYRHSFTFSNAFTPAAVNAASPTKKGDEGSPQRK